MEKKVLIIEDDISFGQMLLKWFERNNYEAELCGSIEAAKVAFVKSEYDLILTDLRLPDGNGIELLNWINERKSKAQVIMMTGYGEIQTAVSAIKLGAFDFLEKPINPSILKEKIEAAIKATSAIYVIENQKVKVAESVKGTVNLQKPAAPSIVRGNSKLSRQMYSYVDTVAPTNMSVMIIGESGTGKEHVARLIHESGTRAGKPFIAVDCGSLSLELAPSELFGHKKGSFTSAIEDKTGFFVEANGGTLFLDEVGNLPYGVQMQLLRTLQERQVRPVGVSHNISVDVRIIAATNENLDKAIAEGKFREDLYHRINEFEIKLPSLRNCKEDIELYAEHFMKEANAELNKKVQHISDDVIKVLQSYSWPGNLRELRNVIRRAMLFVKDNILDVAALPVLKEPEIKDEARQEETVITLTSEEEEKQRILIALERTNGNKSKAAKLLNIDRKTLYNKIKRYNL